MKKGDKFILVFVALIFLISIESLWFYRTGKQENQIAVIEKDGKVLHKIDIKNLKEKKEIKIELEDGRYNIIEIEKGRIRFKDANCRDKVCIRSGWLSRNGDMAICLPNRVSIKILGEREDVDGVAY
ncbi:NusG domain II-containing protein [Hathewaya histolytica]|uniref:NusG domain II-containing protein n=1 Tax=Hathewaya histolytica TaxID=1498 RepID=UPI003B685C86